MPAGDILLYEQTLRRVQAMLRALYTRNHPAGAHQRVLMMWWRRSFAMLE